jgi:hypothetical protein
MFLGQGLSSNTHSWCAARGRWDGGRAPTGPQRSSMFWPGEPDPASRKIAAMPEDPSHKRVSRGLRGHQILCTTDDGATVTASRVMPDGQFVPSCRLHYDLGDIISVVPPPGCRRVSAFW